MNYYANTDTFEYVRCSSLNECGDGNWVLMPEKSSTLCSVGDDLTWQPPLPAQEDKYDWDSVNLSWVKR